MARRTPRGGGGGEGPRNRGGGEGEGEGSPSRRRRNDPGGGGHAQGARSAQERTHTEAEAVRPGQGGQAPDPTPPGPTDPAAAADLAARQRAIDLARQEADRAQRAGRTNGTAESLVTPDGQHGYAADSGREFPVYDHEVRGIIDTVDPVDRPDWHGYCALPQCIENALNDGVDPTGSWVGSAAVRAPGVGAHGKYVAPCPSCQPLMDHYGLRPAQ